MRVLDISADELVAALLRLSETETVCILDSCGVGHLGSHLLIAGIDPIETLEVVDQDPNRILTIVDEKLSGDLASIFSLSYEFGQKLLGIPRRKKEFESPDEPDLFLAQFDAFVIHDYDTGSIVIEGNAARFDRIEEKIKSVTIDVDRSVGPTSVSSNFTRDEYLTAIEQIKELIRSGDTYQTNLTQKLTATLPSELTSQQIFWRLRRDHPAPFAAFIVRRNSTVISASPERFFSVNDRRTITTSPIKGTRPRGETPDEDNRLRDELLTSAKDRAENTMIVDLLRNDLGRVCDYGSVRVEKLCELEEHPTFFHLVSTISGGLGVDSKISDILRAVFPCGSITGAPKISTMKIIDEIETADRGLSMGAIGYSIPNLKFKISKRLDLSVAIRTMVVRDRVATFNVGGGITIDSDPEEEYDETLTKAKALLAALGVGPEYNL